LPKSHSHYRDFLDLRGDGRIVLYKRAAWQLPVWIVARNDLDFVVGRNGCFAPEMAGRGYFLGSARLLS
jgi:hypothetical protein